MGDNYWIESTFLDLGLIGCESTKKVREIHNFEHKIKIRKYKCHQKIPLVLFYVIDISNYGLILNTEDFRKQFKYFKIIMFWSLALFVFKIRS